MSNLHKRVLSGIILGVMVLGCIIVGQVPSLCMMGLVGLLTVDEIITNFFEKERSSLSYMISQISFMIIYGFLNFYYISNAAFQTIISVGTVFDLLLLIYLFLIQNTRGIVLKSMNKSSAMIGLFVLFPIASIAYVLQFSNWKILLGCLLILNFSVDIFAYFFGKHMGKHKLWPSVSPNKTVEGAIGGVFSSVLISSLYWHFFIDQISIVLVVIFMFLAACSQLGDLVQSKLKRQFKIKDSSSLIPGHGGVYDRIDSLLFVAPLFAVLLSVYIH